jgi:hypothetical protein
LTARERGSYPSANLDSENSWPRVKKRHKSFHWTKEAEKSFNLLKKKIMEQPILVLLDFSKTFQVKCDTSGFAIGAVLSQDKGRSYTSARN